jgi:hypothetical protein
MTLKGQRHRSIIEFAGTSRLCSVTPGTTVRSGRQQPLGREYVKHRVVRIRYWGHTARRSATERVQTGDSSAGLGWCKRDVS